MGPGRGRGGNTDPPTGPGLKTHNLFHFSQSCDCHKSVGGKLCKRDKYYALSCSKDEYNL